MSDAIEVPQDEESEEHCYDEEPLSNNNEFPDFLHKTEKTKFINYTKPTHGSFATIENLVESKNQRLLLSIFEEYKLSFCVREAINTVKTPFREVLTYLKTIGKIIFLHYEICVIQKDDTIFLVYIEGNNITQIMVHVYSHSTEKAYENLEFFKQQFDVISAKDKINMELNWYYYSQPRVRSAYITEEINDPLIKEAYPYLDVDEMVDAYLESNEPVLILLGPPGTGKTRLIRHILKKRYDKDESVKVAFTSDQHVIENSEIFMDFLLGEVSTLIIEDIDYHLRPRKEGNTAMYNFLTASNSIVINYFHKKKIILSTNLPDVKNIDEALLRPGRCFDIIQTRPLVSEETKELLKVINRTDELPEKKYTIAEIFNAKNKMGPKKAGF